MAPIVNTPDQEKAIRSLMASRRREWTSDGRTGADFPKWKPGMKTSDYIQVHSIGKNVLPYDLPALARPAPFEAPEGEPVVAQAGPLRVGLPPSSPITEEPAMNTDKNTPPVDLAAEGLQSVPLEFAEEVAQGNVKAAMKTSGATSGDLWRVPLDEIHVLPGLNVRGMTDEYAAHIERTAQSILAEGFYPDKALAVFVGEDGKVYLRDGHTRLLAAKRARELGAQLTVLPCATAPKGSTMEDFTIGLVKSNEGRPLRPIEVAVVMKRLAGWGWDSKRIAERLNYTVAYVDELLGLLAAPKALVALVEAGKVSTDTATKAIKTMGPTKAAEVITTASAANTKKGGKVNPSDIGQSKAQLAVASAKKKEAANPANALPETAQAPTKPAKKDASGDPLKALRAVFDDPNFNKLSDKAQSAVLAVLNP